METTPQNLACIGNPDETTWKPPVSASFVAPQPGKQETQSSSQNPKGHEDKPSTPKPTEPEMCAEVIMSPFALASATISGALKIAKDADKMTIMMRLHECVELLSQGSMEHAESMALMQAKTLECVFHELLSSAFVNRGNTRFTPLLKLALRAQAQSARTLEVLGSLKKPTVFAEQMNLAQQQVVNNTSQAQPEAESKPKISRTRKTVRSAQKPKPSAQHGNE